MYCSTSINIYTSIPYQYKKWESTIGPYFKSIINFPPLYINIINLPPISSFFVSSLKATTHMKSYWWVKSKLYSEDSMCKNHLWYRQNIHYSWNACAYAHAIATIFWENTLCKITPNGFTLPLMYANAPNACTCMCFFLKKIFWNAVAHALWNSKMQLQLHFPNNVFFRLKNTIFGIHMWL